MKAPIIILFSACALAMNSCRKDGNTKETRCEIEMVRPLYGTPLTFTYDESSRLKTITKGTTRHNYEYSDNTIVVTTDEGANFGEVTHTYKLNSEGLPINLKVQVKNAPGSGLNYDYIYENGLLKKTRFSSATTEPKDDITFVWENGNMIGSTSNGITTQYEYYSEPYNGFDFLDLDRFLNFPGIPIIRNKNRVKSITIGSYVQNLSYEIDEKGRVKLIKVADGRPIVAPYDVYWLCN